MGEQLQLPLLHNSLLPQFNNSNLSPNNNLSHNRLLLQYKACSPEPATTILVQEFLAVRRPLVQFNNNNSFLNSSLFPNSSCLPAPTGRCSSSTFYWNLHQPSW